ncbi:hypothetical protein DMUE_3299 [Dictyocoela muelleri]|nr:hypothetical protein DMUE_3299 [Dictyocoela muelleri]
MRREDNYYHRIILPIVMGEPILAIRFLMEKGLLSSTQNCSLCLKPMKLSLSEKLLDNFTWRCNNYKCHKVRTTKGVRSGSVFENVNVKLSRIIHLLYLWDSDYSIKNIIHLTGIGKNTVLKFCGWLRKSCAFHLQKNPIYLGGEVIVCQVDESCFSARKIPFRRTVRQI